MKPKPDEKTEVTATTKVKLTIRGQTFEMTMEELKALHAKIEKVVGEKPAQVIHVPVPMPRERPFYPPRDFYRHQPDPTWPGDRIMCLSEVATQLP